MSSYAAVLRSAFAVLLIACAAPIRTAPVVDASEFGPAIVVYSAEGDVDGARFSIRSVIEKRTGAIAGHQVVARKGSGEWRDWMAAQGEDATALQFRSLSHDVSSCTRYGCALSESFGIMLPDSTLRAHAASGYRIRVLARSGDVLILSLTAMQINSQIAAVDSAVVQVERNLRP